MLTGCCKLPNGNEFEKCLRLKSGWIFQQDYFVLVWCAANMSFACNSGTPIKITHIHKYIHINLDICMYIYMETCLKCNEYFSRQLLFENYWFDATNYNYCECGVLEADYVAWFAIHVVCLLGLCQHIINNSDALQIYSCNYS